MKYLYTLVTILVCHSLYALHNPSLQQQALLDNTCSLFEENKGQVTGTDASQVKYVLKEGGFSIFLLNNRIAYQFNRTHYPKGYKHLDKTATPEEHQQMDKLQKSIWVETYRMDVCLVGANTNAKISTEDKSNDYVQYYNHNALDVHSYSKITYHNVYPNIDWVLYKKGNNVEYDFVVHPGGNPKQIKLDTKWVEKLHLNENGSLTMKNRMGEVSENTPISFQGEKKLNTSFKVEGNIISFDVENYNPNKTLIIDPLVRVWATYYGGSGDDKGMSCAVDGSGNIYVAGWTTSSLAIALGGHQNTFGGSGTYDAFLAKFNTAGVRQWGTYYGGIFGDYGTSCAVDGSGYVYLAGYTGSTSSIADAGHQIFYGGGYDAFLVKFNAAGVRQWGTYYGGDNEDKGYSCKIDGLGNVYLTGYTYSIISIAAGGHLNTYSSGSYTAFLVKFNAAGVRQWGTYYGGGNHDCGFSCAMDGAGNVYLAGETQSSSSVASGGHQNKRGGNRDAFLVKFNTAGVRQWGTYYGGSNDDVGSSCAVDGNGNVYLAGTTGSDTSIAFGGYQNMQGGGGYDAYLVKFNTLGVRQWGTYYGGGNYDVGSSCAVDGTGNIYLAGTTSSDTSIAYGGYQNTKGGANNDAYLVKFNAAGVRQWGTYYGGSNDDLGSSCAVDGTGKVYLLGYTKSLDSIASAGHQNTQAGDYDAFLAKFDSLSICTPNSSNIIQSACGSYVFNNQTITQSGVFLDTLQNTAGCDSIVTLNLTINVNPTPTVTASGYNLTTQSYVAYQWQLNGNNIAGATTQNYTAIAYGSYAVLVTDGNGCQGTSAAMNISGVGINSISQNDLLFNIHPNPATSVLRITCNTQGPIQARVLSATGQLVSGFQFVNTINLNIEDYAQGVYIIQCIDKNGHTSLKRFVKE